MTNKDAKPIVHAHWIEGQTNHPNIHNILCSCCLNGYPSKGHANSQYTKERFKWCPSCGARMDEKVEKKAQKRESELRKYKMRSLCQSSLLRLRTITETGREG